MRDADRLEVLSGSITDRGHTFLIDNMCLIVDMDSGALVEYGDGEKSDIRSRFAEMHSRLERCGLPDTASALRLIEFGRHGGGLTMEEICTVVNYGMGARSEGFADLFRMDEKELHERIRHLQEHGY